MSAPIELRPMGASKPPIPPRHPEATNSLHSAYRSAEDKAKAVVHLQEGQLDAISIWGIAIASWFTVLAIPLLLFPRILLFFAQVPPTVLSATGVHSDHYDALTPLESHLCLTLSFGLIALALITLFTLIPTYQLPSTNPSRIPLLVVLTGLTTLVALIQWNTASIGGLAKVLALGNTVVAAWGWWVAAFGQGRSKLANVGKKHTPDRLKRL